jgi:hypothetical protein
VGHLRRCASPSLVRLDREPAGVVVLAPEGHLGVELAGVLKLYRGSTNPMVNSFETTFQATNGTTVVCSLKFHGSDVGDSSSYQFKSVSCSGPDSGKEYVSCERQYGAAVERFRVWLTLNNLE